MAARWVVLTKLNDPVQAELMRGLLEAQEIQVLLAQEGAAKALGISVGMLGEIDLMVPEDQEGEARTVLESYYRGDFEGDPDQG